MNDVTNTVHGGADVHDSVPAAGDSATLTHLIAMLREREAGGLKEYGQTVDRTDYAHVDWLREALHESMDKSLYLLRAIETAPVWRPIATAPQDGSVMLLGFVPVGNMQRWDRRVYEGRWDAEQQTFTSVNGFILLTDASHWMPLPAAPEAPHG